MAINHFFMTKILVINSIIYFTNVCHKYIFFKFEKNHKLLFQKNTAMIIIIVHYNFEKAYENMWLEQF